MKDKKPKEHSFRKFTSYYREVWGILTLDLFFALLMTGVSIALPFIIQYVTEFAMQGKTSYLAYTFIIAGGLLIIRMISQFYVSFWGNIMGNKMEVIMRRDATAKLHRLETKYFDTYNSGSIVSRVVHDLRDITQFAHSVPEDSIVGFATAVGGLTFAFLKSWLVGVVLLSIFIITLVFWYFRSKSIRASRIQIRAQNAIMSASISNQVDGISESRSYVNTELEKERFEKIQGNYSKVWRKTFFKLGIWDTFNILVITTITLSVLLVGSLQVINHKINVAELAGLISAAALMNQPIQKFIQVYNTYSAGLASIERFYEFMNGKEEFSTGTIPIRKFKGLVEFKNVNFAYRTKGGKKEYVLKDFSIKIKPGEKIAFVGETGIGKSTILKLVLRFYEIESGEILIDGINIQNYKIEDFRKAIVFIQQNTTIFMGNIYENIQYGKPSASKRDVEKAAREALIHKSILKMPEKYNTFTGPNGAQLSGGQRQRISLARSFLKDSSIILMDEATSALDNKTEMDIKKTIAKITKNKTAIIVAHRLTTIQEVDRVIVLGKHGVILEEGTHDSLIKRNGVYAMLSKIK